MICNLVSFLVFEVFELFFFTFHLLNNIFQFSYLSYDNQWLARIEYITTAMPIFSVCFVFFVHFCQPCLSLQWNANVFLYFGFKKYRLTLKPRASEQKNICYLWSVPSSDFLSMQLFLQFIFFTVAFRFVYLCNIVTLRPRYVYWRNKMWLKRIVTQPTDCWLAFALKVTHNWNLERAQQDVIP